MSRQRRAARAASAGTGAPLSGPGTHSPVGAATPKPVLTLDALGKKCPIPIIKAEKDFNWSWTSSKTLVPNSSKK